MPPEASVKCGATSPIPETEARIQAMRETNGLVFPSIFEGCGLQMFWHYAYRCVECGRWFHMNCIGRHFADSRDDVKAVECLAR